MIRGLFSSLMYVAAAVVVVVFVVTSVAPPVLLIVFVIVEIAVFVLALLDDVLYQTLGMGCSVHQHAKAQGNYGFHRLSMFPKCTNFHH